MPHPSSLSSPRASTKPPAKPSRRIEIPSGTSEADLKIDGNELHLTNLTKLFWPDDKITKRDLLQYYANIAPTLLPHLRDRAMVMKRYPDGAFGKFFFQKHAPESKPAWVPVCNILHPSANLVDFPVIQNVSSLLWVINLGCIDLNPWYATCDNADLPDYLHFDLDPTPGAVFTQVLETALLVRDALATMKIVSYAKTSGSRGIHVYIPIVRGPDQKQVWTFAKAFSKELEAKHSNIVTAEYRVAKRPDKHILVDYNQNAWGRTLASVYSVRPKPRAPVSAPVTWKEIEDGLVIEDFRLDNMPERIKRAGDLFKPMLAKTKRVKLERFL